MTIGTLKDIQTSGKKILLRADLNVPVKNGQVTDTTRIDRLKPTIDTLSEKGAKIILMSHFGRPKGEKNADYSLEFIIPALERQWGKPVAFAKDCIGEDAEQAVNALNKGEMLLLENVRFYDGEEKNDPDFARKLAALGDIFVNDAFSAAHRAHASTEGIAHLLPCAAGLLMETELNALATALETPVKPVAALVGGSKISTKLGVLKNLVEKVDYLVLGGGMANTFLLAQGAELGKSLAETEMVDEAKSIMQYAAQHGCQIILPEDCICVKALEENAEFETCKATDIPPDLMAVDVGPNSLEQLKSHLDQCKTVLWNGPLGVFEIPPFDNGTNQIAQYVAQQTKAGNIISVAGGGDTIAALENAGCINDFSYISTAGGAFLEWLQGKTLPGVAALDVHNKAA